jgi:Na+/phosphate symporter
VADEVFVHYRAEIERLLDLVDELCPAEQDRVRQAVRLRRDDANAREQIHGTAAESVGGRLLDQLEAADAELMPRHVRELEALIEAIPRSGTTDRDTG